MLEILNERIARMEKEM
jgi:hypothetical protein